MSNEELEIVLNELLEEQKKETLAKAEIIAILKQLSEKTNGIERQLQPGGTPTLSERIRAIQLWCKDREEVPGSTKAETILTPLPVVLPKTIIKFLYPRSSFILVISFAFLSMLSATGLYKKSEEIQLYKKSLNRYKVNDLKYRYIKANSYKGLIKIFRHADSLYNVEPIAMLDSVLQSEKRTIK